MAQMYKIEDKVEVQCSAEKLFETLKTKIYAISEHCSDKVPSIEVHKGGWFGLGTSRKWDMNIGGKSTSAVERIDRIDEENMVMSRSMIEGEILNFYRSMNANFQVISKGNNNDNKSCIMVCSLEYIKIDEDTPEPKEFLGFILGVTKDLGPHLA